MPIAYQSLWHPHSRKELVVISRFLHPWVAGPWHWFPTASSSLLVGSPAEKAFLLAVSSWFLQARGRVTDGNCCCFRVPCALHEQCRFLSLPSAVALLPSKRVQVLWLLIVTSNFRNAEAPNPTLPFTFTATF